VSFVARDDYAYPLRIDGGSQQAAHAAYADHVRQMVIQVLLTSPGERVDLPQFGCGLRQLVFAPLRDSLDTGLKLQIAQALGTWLAGVVDVSSVAVDAGEEDGTVEVTVIYTLVDTQTSDRAVVILP
jgi:phage baseplate assembly protein W